MNGHGFRRDRRGTSLPLAAVAALLPLGAVPLSALPLDAAQAMDMPSMPGMKMSGMSMHGDVTRTAVAGPYRIELHVLPPEPFYTAADVAARQPKAGMLVVRGAAPVAPQANPVPNHHLIVHVFANGQPLADATVSLSYRRTNSAGEPTGDTVQVPVVVMQAIGGGAATTHYGNNVQMPPGAYLVNVVVNGTSAAFRITL